MFHRTSRGACTFNSESQVGWFQQLLHKTSICLHSVATPLKRRFSFGQAADESRHWYHVEATTHGGDCWWSLVMAWFEPTFLKHFGTIYRYIYIIIIIILLLLDFFEDCLDAATLVTFNIFQPQCLAALASGSWIQIVLQHAPHPRNLRSTPPFFRAISDVRYLREATTVHEDKSNSHPKNGWK
jgi:hypothetical protein